MIRLNGVTGPEPPVPDVDPDPVESPLGCSTGRLAENDRLTGCPSPGTCPSSGIPEKLTSGERL